MPVGEHGRPFGLGEEQPGLVAAKFESGSRRVVIRSPRPRPVQPVGSRWTLPSWQLTVDVLVDGGGVPVAATVRDQAGLQTGDVNTIKSAVREWKFRPATDDGAPVFYVASLKIDLASRE